MPIGVFDSKQRPQLLLLLDTQSFTVLNSERLIWFLLGFTNIFVDALEKLKSVGKGNWGVPKHRLREYKGSNFNHIYTPIKLLTQCTLLNHVAFLLRAMLLIGAEHSTPTSSHQGHLTPNSLSLPRTSLFLHFLLSENVVHMFFK